MRKYMLLLLICLLAFALPGLAQTQDPAKAPPKEQPKEPPKDTGIGGVWIMTMQMPQGEMPPNEVTFTQEKEAIKVSMPGPQGITIAGEGTVKEGVVQWTSVISTPNGDFTLLFKGKVDGEKMSGEVQMGDFGTATWAATKKK